MANDLSRPIPAEKMKSVVFRSFFFFAADAAPFAFSASAFCWAFIRAKFRMDESAKARPEGVMAGLVSVSRGREFWIWRD